MVGVWKREEISNIGSVILVYAEPHRFTEAAQQTGLDDPVGPTL